MGYGPGPARFAGATYDFTSHYRGAAVFKFFEEQALTVEKLRELSQHHTGKLASAIDVELPVPLSSIGGFFAVSTSHAARLQRELRQQNILTDYRGDTLRLGPAPYITDEQIETAAAAIARNSAARLHGISSEFSHLRRAHSCHDVIVFQHPDP